MARAKAARRLRGSAAIAGPPGEGEILVMPGRNVFGRRAGNQHHITRCSMCHPGRHHGPGGKKGLKKKKTYRSVKTREMWLDTLREAREASRAGVLRDADLYMEAQQLSRPEVAEPLPPAQIATQVCQEEEEEVQPWQPPPPAAAGMARGRRRRQGTRRHFDVRCACCLVDRGGRGIVAETGSPPSSDYVIVGSSADSEEWELV